MTEGVFRFDRFTLDPGERRLWNDDAPVELSARYLDALLLMLRENGKLISKDRFMDEVWRGVPVTDEALTQCIRSLRKALGDDAARPRFIETVPKYGYRFVGVVEAAGESAAAVGSGLADEVRVVRPTSPLWLHTLLLAIAAAIGGGFAGMLGGIIYGFAGVTQPLSPGMGSISVLLVLMSLCIVVGLAGGLGVGLGIAAASRAGANGSNGRTWLWIILGGAAGGLVVGAIAKLLGLDAFTLLLGRTPAHITGAGEGVLLGAAVGLGVAWGGGQDMVRAMLRTALTGGVAGMAIAAMGGKLMGGSLGELARLFPESRLRLDQIGALFGETGFGPVSQIVTAGIEAALFSGCLAGAMLLARRQMA